MGVIIHILVRCGGNDTVVSGFEGQQNGGGAAASMVLSPIC